MTDFPSWASVLGKSAAFVALMVASQAVGVYLLTGAWGGTPNDPLWVGPVSAALAMFNTIGTVVIALLLADSWKTQQP
ncbi:hypothetical protein [Nonomuraea guangzhouensis]|uniref:Uncharacterized protein n=1 Tax=Nonomuraea guangzhouensis TaxID=1291555 RepID=A0ABW4GWY3_9ACTN|nr:hypothetical protein [Nonomuraea guangzhouensis]